jgi:hypothetical protein
MTAWTSDELNGIAEANEVELTSLHANGTPREPVTIWTVRNGDDLYIRSWRGRTSIWFRDVQRRPTATSGPAAWARTSGSSTPSSARSTGAPVLRPTSSRW